MNKREPKMTFGDYASTPLAVALLALLVLLLSWEH